MLIILIGIPGAGKGTIANQLKEKYAFRHISTGDILREEVASKSELGNKVKNILDSGELVSDEIMIDMIKSRLTDGAINCILDGFPRTKKQAEALDKIVEVNNVVQIHLTDQEALKRLLNRQDEQGKKREDDKESVIKNRINLFHEQVAPLLEYYRKRNLVLEINGDGKVSEVFNQVVKCLNL